MQSKDMSSATLYFFAHSFSDLWFYRPPPVFLVIFSIPIYSLRYQNLLDIAHENVRLEMIESIYLNLNVSWFSWCSFYPSQSFFYSWVAFYGLFIEPFQFNWIESREANWYFISFIIFFSAQLMYSNNNNIIIVELLFFLAWVCHQIRLTSVT